MGKVEKVGRIYDIFIEFRGEIWSLGFVINYYVW